MSNDESDRSQEIQQRMEDAVQRTQIAWAMSTPALFWAPISKAYNRVIAGECTRVDGPYWTVRKFTSYVEIRIFGSVT